MHFCPVDRLRTLCCAPDRIRDSKWCRLFTGYNLRKETFSFAEPLLERWPFAIAYKHEGVQLRLMFSSDACLNLVATAAAFRSIGDARSFLQALSAPVPTAATYAGASAAVLTTSKVASLCSNYRQAPLIHVHSTIV